MYHLSFFNMLMNKKNIFKSYGSDPPSSNYTNVDFQNLCKISIFVLLQPSKFNKTQDCLQKFTFTCERTFIKVHKSRENFLCKLGINL